MQNSITVLENTSIKMISTYHSEEESLTISCGMQTDKKIKSYNMEMLYR